MRLRDLRKDQETRDEFAEVFLAPEDFILPYFVLEGENKKEPINLLDGVFRFSIDQLLLDIEDSLLLGIDKILLFGVVGENQKDEIGSYAMSPNSIVAKAIRAIKKKFPTITVMADVCLCAYTTHGHCGIMKDEF